MTPSPLILSGVQPTGGLQLGNYLGAIANWVRLQQQQDCLFCIVDLHAITVTHDPRTLTRNTLEMAAALLAAGLADGIDSGKATLFVQSHVPAHAELAWLLNCVARIGWLARMTQFKDKAGKDRESASVGLYAYPVLQAADILAYRATHVPVGADQKQHLELARDIAVKFNADFGVDLFIPPEPLIQGVATRVMSLRDGSKKMSKSDPSDQSRINLTDDADTIALKIRKATTDAALIPDHPDQLADRPEARNLLNIYCALTDTPLTFVLERFAGQGFGTFKPALIEALVATLGPINQRFTAYLKDLRAVEAVLIAGAERAHARAEPIMVQARHAMGFWRP